MEWRFIVAAIGIALLDIVLSGDNALVIAAAASRLPRARRLIAIVWGGIAAIIFRVGLTAAATRILQVPLLQAIGGILLVGIAIHVLPAGTGENRQRLASERFLTAVVTILVADATMSLDNILAVGALAHGNIALIVAGLIFSMAVLFTASALIARLMDALPWLIDLAALVIAYTAADLFVSDPIAQRYFHFDSLAAIAIHVGVVDLVLAVDVFLRWRARRRARAVADLARAPVVPAQSSLNGHTPDTGGLTGSLAQPQADARTRQTPPAAGGSESPWR